MFSKWKTFSASENFNSLVSRHVDNRNGKLLREISKFKFHLGCFCVLKAHFIFSNRITIEIGYIYLFIKALIRL